MAKLSRTPSGLWTARKVIPADVRAAYGKREEKPTWPAGLTASQARAEYAAWLLRVEEQIEALRKSPTEKPIELTRRQARALAGKWYADIVERFGDDPGEVQGWEETLEDLYPSDTDEAYRAYLLDPSAPYEGPYRATPFVLRERGYLLDSEGLKLTDAASEKLLADMLDLYVAFCQLMVQRASGDFSQDPTEATLPKWEAPKAPVLAPANRGDGPTIMDLFDGYVVERKPAEATVKAWKRMMTQLGDFLGHTDAARVTAEDILRWKDHLLQTPTKAGTPRAAKTVRETYLAAAKAVFGWAKENRRIALDPATGIKVRGAKRQRLRDPGFNEQEALTILKATLEAPEGRLAAGNVLARRWVPWLCAYSGARVNELTQLRKQDVIQEDGVWAINITPEAGGTKSGQARKVPLHSHIIAQGFLKVVEQAADGPLFYDPEAHRGGSEGNPQYKKVGERLAKWVRGLGVDDPNVQPNHGWRHRFKTVARGAKMDPEAREVIPGHAPSTEGQAYGRWTVKDLATEIEKLPKYSL
ncbi:MAG: integrase [Sphingobium sp.]|uniref:integrase n=1 Tax=Sphingobium sp. TaxID=1912891 RepID=UPI0029A4E12F|nr:integrase [Sphingobium sp.]MDX3910890.1 integrase [Sphingobium sp.]